MWATLKEQWFLIALAACFALGYLGADLMQPLLAMTLLRGGIVFVVLWAMGVTLKPDTIRHSLAHPLPSLLAIGINVAIVPLLCLLLMGWLPTDLAGGLFITGIVPCTLASASVWTRKAGGDDSIAMMTTIVTNLGCVIIVPLGIWLVLAQQTEIDVANQIQKLAALVVLPLIIAQAMRRLGAADWADRHKPGLSVLGQIGILSMVVFGAAASATTIAEAGHLSTAEPAIAEVATSSAWIALVGLIVASVFVHTFSLCLGVGASKALKMNRSSQIAVGMAGSQKTLMVGLQIAIDCGVSVLPMLVYHLSQLVIDTVVADRWKRGSGDDETR